MPIPFVAAPFTLLTLVAPEMTEAGRERFYGSYPGWALRADQSAAVFHEIIVDPNGRVDRCDVIDFVGSERLAKEICRVIKKRNYSPAVGASGAASYGKIVDVSRMMLLGTKMGQEVAQVVASPDFELAVESLPLAENGRKNVQIVVQVGISGGVQDCLPNSPSDEKYAVVACQSVANEKLQSEKNSAGVAVPYVQKLNVAFVADQGE